MCPEILFLSELDSSHEATRTSHAGHQRGHNNEVNAFVCMEEKNHARLVWILAFIHVSFGRDA